MKQQEKKAPGRCRGLRPWSDIGGCPALHAADPGRMIPAGKPDHHGPILTA